MTPGNEANRDIVDSKSDSKSQNISNMYSHTKIGRSDNSTPQQTERINTLRTNGLMSTRKAYE